MAGQVLASRHYAVTKLRISASVAGDEVHVSANPRHLQQILLNLLVNAEDAQCATLVVRVGQEGSKAAVSIESSGESAQGRPGSSPDRLGIGLEVSQWLAQKNGGTVTFEPAAEGCRAKLLLPAL